MIIEPVALSRDVPACRVIRARLGELDLAVWRSESGVLSAWENRCPHRGMRLSHGFVRGERLACLYHGWHYSTAGFCEIIPAHPDLTPPKTFCTVQFSVVEQNGVIWVTDQRPSDNSTAAPCVPELPIGLQPVRSISVVAPAQSVATAFTKNPPADSTAIDTSKFASTDRILLFRNDGTKYEVVLLLHTVPATHHSSVTVHVLASTHYCTDDLVQLSRWAETVRRAAELSQTTGATP